MNAHQKNKDLLDMYRRTIHNIEKEIKRISLFNKFASKKMINCGQEQLALEFQAKKTLAEFILFIMEIHILEN